MEVCASVESLSIFMQVSSRFVDVSSHFMDMHACIINFIQMHRIDRFAHGSACLSWRSQKCIRITDTFPDGPPKLVETVCVAQTKH